MPLLLTFAELAFLLPPEAADARKRLHLVDWESDSPVPLSGAASLFVRGLAAQDAEGLTASEDLGAVIEALSDATEWVQIGLAREESVGGVQFYARHGQQVEAAAEPFGTFAFSLLDANMSITERVNQLLRDFFAAKPGAAFVKAGRDSMPEQDGLALRRTENGEIELASGDVAAATLEVATLEEALGAVDAYLSSPQ